MEAFVGRFVALTCWCTSHVLRFVCHATDAIFWDATRNIREKVNVAP